MAEKKESKIEKKLEEETIKVEKKADEKKTEDKKEVKVEIKINKSDLEKDIIELGKKGLTAEKIGLELKKKYGVKFKEAGVKIGAVLRKNNIYSDPDIANLAIRIERLKKHLEKNKHDHKTKLSLTIKGAKYNKLNKLKK